MLNYQEEKQLEQEQYKEAFRVGVVEERKSGGYRIKFDGDEVASDKFYKGSSGLYAAVGKKVLCANYKGTYIVMLVIGQ
jgi:hypothetical protein